MEESPFSPVNSRPRLEGTGPSRKLKDLPESLLYAVLAQVSERGEGFSQALVCRKWAQVSMEAQRRVTVTEEASVAESDLLNELSDFPNLRELELKKESALRLTDRFFLGIGVACPLLESITIPQYSSAMRAKFSTAGLQGMISSLPRLKSIVLSEFSGSYWDVPDSVSSLCDLEVLSVKFCDPRASLTIPPSTRKLSFWDVDSWDVAEEEGGFQRERLLIVAATYSDVIPEELWAACSLRSLEVMALHCQHLSTGISRLTALQRLQLDMDSLADLPDCFSTLQSLTQLRLASNNVQTLPDSLWSLTSLNHLSLNCSSLRSLDSGVGRLQRLTSLEVFSQQGTCNFPSSVCGHSALRKLHLFLLGAQPGFQLRARALMDASFILNEETDFSRFLRGCPSVTRLNLSNVQDASSLLGDAGLLLTLQHLRIYGPSTLQHAPPNSFSCYNNLETLEIVNCKGIAELPWSIEESGRLTKLTVQMCYDLRNLPQQLGSLGNLRTLDIRDCPELQCLPRSIGQLSSLDHLYLGNLSSLRSIPNSLGAAHQLCTLTVSHCAKLNSLPDSLGQLALLTSLSVLNCPLVEELPASMSQLPSLRVLGLEGLPALLSLPEGVEKITTLHSLRVMGCRSLRELPSELGRLKNLRKVVIVECRTLRHLPPSIGDLPLLNKLHLDYLQSLSCIPHQIGQLSSLRDLVIRYLPSLASLPDSMTRLTGLAELDIEGCHSLASVPELVESLSGISEESKLGLRRHMEKAALRGVQQRRS